MILAFGQKFHPKARCILIFRGDETETLEQKISSQTLSETHFKGQEFEAYG